MEAINLNLLRPIRGAKQGASKKGFIPSCGTIWGLCMLLTVMFHSCIPSFSEQKAEKAEIVSVVEIDSVLLQKAQRYDSIVVLWREYREKMLLKLPKKTRSLDEIVPKWVVGTDSTPNSDF